MNRVFDYNGAAVSHSKPVKQLRTVKKHLIIDSGDRDTAKYPTNGDFVVYLPRVYENVVGIRLVAAELPSVTPYPITATGTAITDPRYFLLDIEGLNKMDECSKGADRSGYPDGVFAKIPTESITTNSHVFYNDHSQQENISHYTPAIGKLDRMRIRIRTHDQKQTGAYVFWWSNTSYPSSGTSVEYSLTFEIEMLDNVFDDFSSFETRIGDRA